MKKYLILILLLMNGLCVDAQESDSFKRSNFLDGSFRASSFNSSSDSKSQIITGFSSYGFNRRSSVRVNLLYGLSVKTHAQHSLGLSIDLGKYENDFVKGDFQRTFGVGLIYQYLYQHYLNKKLAVFGSCTPEFYCPDLIKSNNSALFLVGLKNKIDLGMSYDVSQNWTIRATILSYTLDVRTPFLNNPGRISYYYDVYQYFNTNFPFGSIAIKYYY
jgi:hypothetical protein